MKLFFGLAAAAALAVASAQAATKSARFIGQIGAYDYFAIEGARAGPLLSVQRACTAGYGALADPLTFNVGDVLDALGNDAAPMYHVGSFGGKASTGTCSALSTGDGSIVTVSCDMVLPALCSLSANLDD